MSVHNTAAEGFVKGTEYDRHRPSYTDESIGYIVDHTGLQKPHDELTLVLELGSGTGKFTEKILPKISENIKYIATDPSPTFVDQLTTNCPSVETRVCSADNIPLPDASVKVIFGAQCFHWFANDASLKEMNRVLVPDGMMVLIWNNKDRSVKWVNEIETNILGKYYTPETPRAILGEWKRVIEKSSLFTDRQEVFYSGIGFKGTKETIRDHFSTISVISRLDDVERQVALTSIMDVLNSDSSTKDQKEITLPLVTNIYHCNKGKEYDRYRPSYTDECIGYIVDHTRLQKPHDESTLVLELGSGTGKFTEKILPKISENIKYIATDPSPTFIDQLKTNCPSVETRVCSADNIPLPDASVKVIFGAQCFHWFANDASLKEINRVLVPDGMLVLIWNIRDYWSVKWVNDIETNIIGKYYTSEIPRAILGDWKRVIEKSSLFTDRHEVFYPGISFKGTKETIRDHFSTISVISRLDDDERQVALTSIMNVLNSDSSTRDQKEITLPLRTNIYHCNKVS